jgi:hypothetical protein
LFDIRDQTTDATTMHLWFEAPRPREYSGLDAKGEQSWLDQVDISCFPSLERLLIMKGENLSIKRYSKIYIRKNWGFPSLSVHLSSIFISFKILLSIFWQFNRKLGDSLIKSLIMRSLYFTPEIRYFEGAKNDYRILIERLPRVILELEKRWANCFDEWSSWIHIFRAWFR